MTYEFPPPSPVSWVAVGVHLALLALALSSVAGLLIKRHRPARWSDLAGWASVALLATFLSGYGMSLDERFRMARPTQ